MFSRKFVRKGAYYENEKQCFIVLGFICVAIGFLRILLSILPTTSFLLLATALFAKGSTCFHNWFISAKLYKQHLEEFIVTKSTNLKKKLMILLPVSAIILALFLSVPIYHIDYKKLNTK